MAVSSHLPDEIKKEIHIYLADDEKVLKAIGSTSGKLGAIGEIWLILTSLSVFFFTRRYGREPVVALIERKNLDKVEYLQKISDITLTFIPKRNPSSATRLSFPIEKHEDVDNFCEELADFIQFKKQTTDGIKSYQPEQKKQEQSYARSVRSSDPNVKIVSRSKSSKPRILETTNLKTPQNKADIAEPQTATANHPPSKELPAFNQKNNQKVFPQSQLDDSETETVSLSFIFSATLISVIISVIWYYFFKSISSSNKP